jgi:hypothetical protein
MSPQDRALLGKGGLTAAEAVGKAQQRLEREEQRIFSRELNRLDLPFYWHRTDKPTGATAGVPDFIVGIGGATLWIEFKTAEGIFRDGQIQFARRLGVQGIALHICRSAAEAIELIKDILPTKRERVGVSPTRSHNNERTSNV